MKQLQHETEYEDKTTSCLFPPFQTVNPLTHLRRLDRDRSIRLPSAPCPVKHKPSAANQSVSSPKHCVTPIGQCPCLLNARIPHNTP